jgi:hypothetical protein
MILIYTPSDGERLEWLYRPNKMMSAEREVMERLTGKDFSAVTQGVVEGNALARRVLLYVFLRRAHPTIRFDDVDFAWDELEVEFTREEFAEMLKHGDQVDPKDRAEWAERMTAEMEKARSDESVGKAQAPSGA